MMASVPFNFFEHQYAVQQTIGVSIIQTVTSSPHNYPTMFISHSFLQ